MDDFTNKLSVVDAKEIGFVMAIALHWRNQLALEGLDLLKPQVVLVQAPNTKWKILQLIRKLQRDGEPSFAAGLMVWLHTLRAVSHLELRGHGRRMWAQLQRGFPHIDAGADSAARVFGKYIATDGAGTFPYGLTPEPI